MLQYDGKSLSRDQVIVLLTKHEQLEKLQLSDLGCNTKTYLATEKKTAIDSVRGSLDCRGRNRDMLTYLFKSCPFIPDKKLY